MIHEPLHLGDGAYVSVCPYTASLVISANDHRPAFATDTVNIERSSLPALKTYIDKVLAAE